MSANGYLNHRRTLEQLVEREAEVRTLLSAIAQALHGLYQAVGVVTFRLDTLQELVRRGVVQTSDEITGERGQTVTHAAFMEALMGIGTELSACMAMGDVVQVMFGHVLAARCSVTPGCCLYVNHSGECRVVARTEP